MQLNEYDHGIKFSAVGSDGAGRWPQRGAGIFKSMVEFWLFILGHRVDLRSLFTIVSDADLRYFNVGVDDFCAAVLVLLILLALIVPVEHWAAVQGFGMEDSDELEGLSLLVGINFVKVSIATAVLSTLGAIAEAAMAIAAGLSELIQQHPTIETRALFTAGMHVGQQIIGTTFNTLFFGFFGGFLGLFIWFADLQYTWGELLNNKVLDAELILVLFSLISVILTVPMTTWVMAQRLQIMRKKQD